MDASDVVSGAAWRAFCERLAALGDRILADDFPGDARDRAEGMRHLATQTACWLTYATGYSDADYPAFFRSADPTYAWGGPNVDQVARRADRRRRRHVPRVGPHGIVRGVRAPAQGRHDAERRRQHRHRGRRRRRSGSAPVTRSRSCSAATSSRARGCRSAPGPGFVHVRDYYFDWAPAEPATFVIERLDTAGHVGADRHRRPRRRRCSRPRRTRSSTRSSTSATCRHACATRRSRNRFGVPDVSGRGVQDIIYSHGFVSLRRRRGHGARARSARGRAVGHRARYSRAWYEPLDYATRVTSRNHRQVTRRRRRARAGRARRARPRHRELARHPGPGRGAHHRALVPPAGAAADPQREVVPLADLADHLPDGHPTVDADTRAAEIARPRAARRRGGTAR